MRPYRKLVGCALFATFAASLFASTSADARGRSGGGGGSHVIRGYVTKNGTYVNADRHRSWREGALLPPLVGEPALGDVGR